MPVGHSVQFVAPASENVPLSHWVHPVAFVNGMKPAKQGSHVDALPNDDEIEPGGQTLHEYVSNGR